MDVFAAGTQVKASIELVDAAGNPLSVQSVQWRLLDGPGVELQALTALSGFVAEDGSAEVTVPSQFNQLTTGALREGRRIDLQLTFTDTNIGVLSYVYAIAANDALAVGVNTFQTYQEAMNNADTLGSVPAWDAASERERTQALIEARSRLCRLNFRGLSSDFLPDQASVLRSTDIAMVVNNVYLYRSLELMPADAFLKLPAIFLAALKNAQVVEANEVLTGGDDNQRRRDGVILETIGDVKKMWRSSKPLDLPCSRRALKYVSLWISYDKRIGRA
jgi:hypothetical protein